MQIGAYADEAVDLSSCLILKINLPTPLASLDRVSSI